MANFFFAFMCVRRCCLLLQYRDFEPNPELEILILSSISIDPCTARAGCCKSAKRHFRTARKHSALVERPAPFYAGPLSTQWMPENAPGGKSPWVAGSLFELREGGQGHWQMMPLNPITLSWPQRLIGISLVLCPLNSEHRYKDTHWGHHRSTQDKGTDTLLSQGDLWQLFWSH